MTSQLKTVKIYSKEYQMIIEDCVGCELLTIDREFLHDHGVRLTRHLSQDEIMDIKAKTPSSHHPPRLVGMQAFFFPVLTPCWFVVTPDGKARQNAYPGSWLWVFDNPRADVKTATLNPITSQWIGDTPDWLTNARMWNNFLEAWLGELRDKSDWPVGLTLSSF
jgi:hypothetical protein